MSGQPFQTKFTLGLMTITPCPQPDETALETEENSADDIAFEQAARDAIAAKKARKVARQKSRSISPGKKVGRKKSSDKPMEKPNKEELEAKKRAKEEAAKLEAAKKKKKAEEEEAARRKAEEEEARKKEEKEEAARKKAEEARKKAEEEEMIRQQQEEMARQEAEVMKELANQLYEEQDLSESLGASMASLVPSQKIEKPKRRISFFPVTGCKDNAGLNEALRKYSNDVPFDWEKPEWTKEHVNLRHTSTVGRTYGWEKPDWARRDILRKTKLGTVVKQGGDLGRSLTKVDSSNRTYIQRRHSLSGRPVVDLDMDVDDYSWEKPEWSQRSMLRQTDLGEIVRQGFCLEGSYDFGQKNIAWEKPDWAVNPTLRPTDMGWAVRQGVDLALPVRKLAVPGAANVADSDRDIMFKGHHSVANMSTSQKIVANMSASQKIIAWEKPSWAISSGLKRTSKGELMKETGSLARPITPKKS